MIDHSSRKSVIISNSTKICYYNKFSIKIYMVEENDQVSYESLSRNELNR